MVQFYVKSYTKLEQASHWVDPFTNENIRLTSNLKIVYAYKLHQYNSFEKLGQFYNESHQRVADLLGLDYDNLRRVIIPLLKRMNLIEIEKTGHKKYITTVKGLKTLTGRLINPKGDKWIDKSKTLVKRPPMTHEEYKLRKKNREFAERILNNLSGDYSPFMRDKD